MMGVFVRGTMEVVNSEMIQSANYIYTMNRILVAVLLCLGFASCSNKTPATSSSVDSDSIRSAEKIRADINHICCFGDSAQFIQFFPASFEDVREVQPGVIAIMNCNDDTITKTFGEKEYTASGEHFKVVLTDFSRDTATLHDYYLQSVAQYRDDKGAHEFNEMEVPGVYHGFSYFTLNAKKIYMLVDVNDRFMYEITSTDVVSTKNALKILNGLPAAALAKWCR